MIKTSIKRDETFPGDDDMMMASFVRYQQKKKTRAS